MRYFFYIYFLAILLISCNQKQKADSIFYHARIYTIDSVDSRATAFAVKDGKIIAVGFDKKIINDFDAAEKVDLQNNFVYPGLIDAHSHFYGLGVFQQSVDLTETKSWDEVIQKCSTYFQTHQNNYLIGRGWDQNKWPNKNYPNNDELNKLFPNIPVLLKRVDGHAAIANDFLLKQAAISLKTKISGGEVLSINNKVTGVLIDNAVDLVQQKMPHLSLQQKIDALKTAEKICFENGLTTICDAGLDKEMIDLIDSLQKCNQLSIRVYAMINADEKNLNYYLKIKPYKTDKLNAGSFKMYADGSLGSRGAALLQPYSDMHNHYGFLLNSIADLEKTVKRISESSYQLNTHCIGDSANRLVLKLYAKYLKVKNDKRWRIEHAQVINENDFEIYKQFSIIPSVQPTHATSDMYWASGRLGNERIKNAYAYKKLLNQNGWLPLGTDFPVESVNPFYTFYAAIARKDAHQFPENGFQNENALTREEALKGMTIWAAKAAFEEHEKGSLELGKFADFIVLKFDLLKDDLSVIRNTKPELVYINGVNAIH